MPLKKMRKNKKKENDFDYELHYQKNEDFYDKLITNVELRNYLIVRGKDFSECVKSHAFNNIALLDLKGEKICIYTGFAQITPDKFTKRRIIAGAHRANFLDNSSTVVSSLLARVDISEFEEDFPGISRLLGSGFQFQTSFIATHFSNNKYGLKKSELAVILAYVGSAVLDFSAFLFSDKAAKCKDIDDLRAFLTFVNKLPEQDRQQLKDNMSSLTRQISRQKKNFDRTLIKHVSLIHQMCSKIKNRKISLREPYHAM